MDFEKLSLAITHPRHLRTLAEASAAKDATEQTGVYGWWIKNLPETVPLANTYNFGEFHLVYAGKSGSKAISRRLKTHFVGKCASHSTLRKTLGCLLIDQLQLTPIVGRWVRPKRNNPNRLMEPRLGWGKSESRLTEWMQQNARVVWLATDDYKEVEDWIIATVDLPLNQMGNERHPFHPTLKALRAQWLAHALESFLKDGGKQPTYSARQPSRQDQPQSVNEFTTISKSSGYTDQLSRGQPTLHKAMEMILIDWPDQTATTKTLAAENIKRDLYRKGDGSHPKPSQFWLRAKNYGQFKQIKPDRVQFVGS